MTLMQGEAFDDLGSHFAMEDYHVISMDSIDSKAVDNGVALHVDDDALGKTAKCGPLMPMKKTGNFNLFFPAKDYEGIFRIGVAISDSPTGPFKAEPKAIEGSFSIDPAVFKDDDGAYYMYFGGLWGGQLQRWKNKVFLMPISLKVLPLSFQQTTNRLCCHWLLKCPRIYWHLAKLLRH
jgi:hypothetical protein